MKEQALDILKKFWFVMLVGIIFISFAVYFAWDTNKDKIPGKQVNGKDVIFSVDGYDYTADSYYKKLFNNKTNETEDGIATLYTLLEKNVSESVDATDEMKETAKTSYEQFMASWESNYGNGSDSEDYLDAYIGTQLKALGYENGADQLEEFYLNQQKMQVLLNEYVKEHTELFDAVFEKENPREISHILIKATDEETAQKKMAAVEKRLKDGDSFAKVAKDLSEDEGSKADGGSIGVQTKDALVSEFAEKAWSLKDGETSSEWVKTDYGYHLIKIDNTSKKKMLKKESNLDSITSLIINNDSTLQKKIVWEKAKDLGFECKDKDTKKALMEYIGVEK